MQIGFGFAAADIARWHARLAPVLATLQPLPARRPVAQLVKSIISGRTKDAVSQKAFDRLTGVFATPARLAAADPAAVERVIADVTFAADKAAYVVGTMRRLRAGPLGFDLKPLAAWPLADALGWLETLPGVARKVSASTLNASTREIPVMIVDTHVLRVLRRLGAIAAGADYRIASETVTAAMPGWRGADFLAFHAALKRLGQIICRPETPVCGRCPLRLDCLSGRQGTIDGLPPDDVGPVMCNAPADRRRSPCR